MSDRRTWALTDHLCRGCGGRILRCVTGNGMTPGGNPVYKCANCGKAGAAMSTDHLCWCGFSHKLNHNVSAYVCVPYSELEAAPQLLKGFLACGCDPKNGGEVGIMLVSTYDELLRAKTTK
jgi:hypothetical protein